MKKLSLWLLALVLVGALTPALAQTWLQLPVAATTNETVVVLDGRFTPPVMFLGYHVYPNPLVFTNNIINTNSMKYVHRNGVEWASSVSGRIHTNNVPLYITDLNLLVGTGDKLVFTNSISTGNLLINFQME